MRYHAPPSLFQSMRGKLSAIPMIRLLHRPKRSVDSSDLRSKSVDFECLSRMAAFSPRARLKCGINAASEEYNMIVE